MVRPTSQDLGKLPLFGGLPADALSDFAERAELVSVGDGATVFREEEPARALYILRSGSLEVIKRSGPGDVRLATIRPGECFGEMSFIDMQPRSATVRAIEPSTMWSWAYTSFHERYCRDQKCAMLLVMNIARELSRRLRRADEKLARSH